MHRETAYIWTAFPQFPFTLGFVGVFAPCRWEYLTIPSVSHFLERFPIIPPHLFQLNKPTAHCSFTCDKYD